MSHLSPVVWLFSHWKFSSKVCDTMKIQFPHHRKVKYKISSLFFSSLYNDLCGVKLWVSFPLSCSLKFSTGEEKQTYLLYQSKPIWSHLELWTDLETLLAEERGVSFKPIYFFSFILFTLFHPPLVHTIEAIVVFPSAKTNHKVLLNPCHMFCFCFASPPDSTLKTVAQWKRDRSLKKKVCRQYFLFRQIETKTWLIFFLIFTYL